MASMLLMSSNRFLVGLILLGFWLLLTNGDVYSFVVGIFFIPLAIYVSIILSRHTESIALKTSIKLTKIPSFALFFIIQSFKGGIDTALRAFAKPLNIKPEFIHYHIHSVPSGPPMNLFMNIVSLLPGSVSVIREKRGVLVHVLAKNENTLHEMCACEKAICELFGVEYIGSVDNNNRPSKTLNKEEGPL